MNRSVLPAHPLRLRFGYVATTYALALMMVAIGALVGYLAYDQFSDIAALRESSRLWDDGAHALDGKISGTRDSKLGLDWVIASYRLDVWYVDAAGESHTGKRAFWTMLGGPDTDDRAEIRYDAKQPDRFVTSWEHDASGARWRAVVILGLLTSLMTFVSLLAVWAIPSGARRTARCGRRGDEILARAVSTSEQRDARGQVTHRTFVFEHDGKTISETFKLPDVPLYADEAQQYALALRDGATLQLLRHDGFPFAIGSRELIDLHARLPVR